MTKIVNILRRSSVVCEVKRRSTVISNILRRSSVECKIDMPTLPEGLIFVSAEVGDVPEFSYNNAIKIIINGVLNNTKIPDFTDFIITASGGDTLVTDIQFGSDWSEEDSVLYVWTDRNFVAGETITIQYIKNADPDKQLQGLNGAKVAAFAESVTNNVSGAQVPVLQSITCADGVNIVHTYDIALDETSTPATSAYAFPGHTPNAVVVSGLTVTVTVTERIYWGDSDTSAYTKPATNMIKSTSGGEAASFTATAITNSITLEAETTTLITRFTTPPTDLVKAQINKRIARIKTAGYWTKLDVLVCCDIQDSQAATRNWITDSINGTLVNSPTFTDGSGFKNNDGTFRYINTNFTPSISGTQHTLNNGIFFVNLSGVSLSGTTIQAHGGKKSAIETYATVIASHATVAYNRLNDNGTPTDTSILTNGLMAVARNSSSVLRIYKNGGESTYNTNTTGLSTQVQHILSAFWQTSEQYPSNANTYAKNYGWGAYLTYAEAIDIRNILNDA